ncbi:MAG TPA: serine/threonine-protein kinase [Propionibacteriaceae bacterium]|nr:serine/threonine-protein kinase [Propionibacteriaceae bacterium]HEX3286781.1 serine/threonine-protein kinase [Mycobacterium sp.]
MAAPVPPEIPGMADWRAIARGGFAIVWQARQESLNRLVAVKVDERKLDSDAEQRRFLREAGAAGRMSGHPGIVTVHDAGLLGDDRPFLVMELCPGGSLTRWMTQDPRPSQRRVRDVGVRIADALSAAHLLGVLHRDVKPANILIDAYNNAGLADFGLAALIDPDTPLSETVEAITPAYAPPEVFAKKPLTEYADVYSLAATLYAVLSGHAPRWSDTTETPSIPEIIKRQRAPIKRIPGVDKAFMDVLLKAMAENPEDRPTAAQFRDQLSALNLTTKPAPRPLEVVPEPPSPPRVAEEPVAVKVEPAANRWRNWEHRRLATVAIAAVIIAVAAAIVLANLFSVDRPAAVPTPAASVTSNVATPVTTPVVVPAGFIDCSEQLGADTYCASRPECWAGVQGLSDVPELATPYDCDKVHVYQTFIAGRLTYDVRRQSQLDSDAHIRRVCTNAIANSMLGSRDRRSDWEIRYLGPQQPSEYFFRCIIGRGERSEPLEFQAPG